MKFRRTFLSEVIPSFLSLFVLVGCRSDPTPVAEVDPDAAIGSEPALSVQIAPPRSLEADSRWVQGPDLPLSTLADGLRWVYPFEDNLRYFSSDGHVGEAAFSRPTPASLPDLRFVPADQPRFLDGRYGGGLWIEYSPLAMRRPISGYNHFPPEIASAHHDSGFFQSVGDADIMAAPALRPHENAMRVRTTGDGGVETVPVVTPMAQRHVFSVYLRAGKPDTALRLSVRIGETGDARAETTVVVGTAWQRAELSFTCTDATVSAHSPTGETEPMRFRVVGEIPAEFDLDAWMLEPQARYGGRRTASTWIPGHSGRGGEILRAGEPVSVEQGTLAFWTTLAGDMGWRVLLTVGYGHGWHPDFRLDLRDQRRFELLARGMEGESLLERFTRPTALVPGEWHHVALTWNAGQVGLYLDGDLVITMTNAPPRERLGEITLGGVDSNFSPAVRADACFDEFSHWDRTLSPAEITRLAGRTASLLDGFPAHGIFLEQREPITVFARDDRSRMWHVELFNFSASPLTDLQFHYGIEGVFTRQEAIGALASGHAVEFALPWSPAQLRAGTYVFNVTVMEGETILLRRETPLSIVPARIPMDNAQVISWGGHSRVMAAAGITVGGLTADWQGPRPHELAAATRRGLYTQARVSLVGQGQADSDRFVDAAGQPGRVDQRMSAPTDDLRRKASALAATLERMPDVRYAILNCENQWIWNVDFRPQTMASVQEQFGLDLRRWLDPPVQDPNRIQLPFGRLNPRMGGIETPAEGVVDTHHPFYAFSRWWQSGAVGNEVFLNESIARIIRSRAPWVQTIWEPALRRPAVRVFFEQDLLNEWFYYPRPARAIWVQERLAAMTRGTRARTTGMPQFLLKPGMAAPYGGMPTPSMFREAVWHCLARPSLGLTYWNLWAALERGTADHVKTQDEIDALLGETPSWEAAAARVDRRGEWSSIFLWIPELPDAIADMHHTVVHPMGALWPRWHNHPRRLAVIQSFAAQLFNGVRWPDAGALGQAVADTGLPFDVLYDQDFEDNPEILHGYSLVVIPESPVIPRPMVQALAAFLSRGGRVLADTRFGATLDGVEILDFSIGTADHDALVQAEQALLAEYGSADHVLFIEGMEEARRQFAASGGPVAQVAERIRRSGAAPVVSRTGNIHVNLLEAEGVRYLVAVNSLSVPCAWYGHFGRTRGQGMPQTAEFELGDVVMPESVAYRLNPGERMPLVRDGEAVRLRLALESSGGAVVAFLPAPIGDIAIDRIPDSVPRGKSLRLGASLRDTRGQPVPGVIPVRVVITDSTGEPLDVSGHGAFVGGRWTQTITVPLNQEVGEYRLQLTDLAAGKTAVTAWHVP